MLLKEVILTISFINSYKLTILTNKRHRVVNHTNQCLRHGRKVFTWSVVPKWHNSWQKFIMARFKLI
jgi:hypothetical protein